MIFGKDQLFQNFHRWFSTQLLAILVKTRMAQIELIDHRLLTHLVS